MKYTKILEAINESPLALNELQNNKEFKENLSAKLGCSQTVITQAINDLMK